MHKKWYYFFVFIFLCSIILFRPKLVTAGCNIPCACPGGNCDRCDTRTCTKNPPLTGPCVSCNLSGQTCWTEDPTKCGGGGAGYITIGGKITNEAGIGIPNVKVHLQNSDMVVENVMTGADGRFTSSANKFLNNRDYAVRPQTKTDGTRDENPETYVGLPKSTNITASAVNSACGGGNVGANSSSYECQLVNGGCGTNCDFKYTSCSSVAFPSISGATCKVDVAGDGRADITWTAPNLSSGYSISRYTLATWKGDLAADPKDYTNTYPADNGKWTKYLCVDHGINKTSTSYPIPNQSASEYAKNWPVPNASWPGRCDWAPLKDNTPAGSASYRPATYKLSDGRVVYTGGVRYEIKDETSGKEVCKTVENISPANFTCTFAPLDTVAPTPATNVRATFNASTNKIDFGWSWVSDGTCANCEERVGKCNSNGKSTGPNGVSCNPQTQSPYWWQVINETTGNAMISKPAYYYNGNDKTTGLSWAPSDNTDQIYVHSCPTNLDEKHDVMRIDVDVRDARGNIVGQQGTAWPNVRSSKTTCCKNLDKGNANCDDAISPADYTIWKCEYVRANGVPCSVDGDVSNKWSDFDMNGRITLRDFEIWRQNTTGF